MHEVVRLRLEPSGTEMEVPEGTLLSSVLFGHGVEFPCGGRGSCGGCRVQVLKGNLPVAEEDLLRLGKKATEDGWRLACHARVTDTLTVRIVGGTAVVAGDDAVVPVTSRDGLGVVVDLGTTTLAAQLIDLHDGGILGVETALNRQGRFGADVMSRLEVALSAEGASVLKETIRRHLGGMIQRLTPKGKGVREVVLAGNVPMHHLFCGLDVKPLTAVPFESPQIGEVRFSSAELGWRLPEDCVIRFLPGVGGFVGSDLLCGLLATDMHRAEGLGVLVDLGTNAEIVAGGKDGLICASTAAGPAFEGGKIEAGMRAATGAICEVRPDGRGGLDCRVIGGTKALGICGSGLIDAAATGLESGSIRPDGRLGGGLARISLTEEVGLIPRDIRELQLAKGAVAAGISILAARLGKEAGDISRLFICGAFGSSIHERSLRRIGLIPRGAEGPVTASGNTALRGARRVLLNPEWAERETAAILGATKHVCLSTDGDFMEKYVEEMGFPEEGGRP